MSSPSDTEKLLRDGFQECAELYKCELEGFYPRHGLIDESNLVRIYIEALKQKAFKSDNRSEVFAWTEYLNGHRQRVDAVIKVGNDLVLLEAKRIKQGSWSGVSKADKALASIHKDSIRLFDKNFYGKIEQDLRNRSEVSGKIYRVLLAAIWLYENAASDCSMALARDKWLRGDPFCSDHWTGAHLSEVKVGHSSGESQKSSLSLLISIK